MVLALARPSKASGGGTAREHPSGSGGVGTAVGLETFKGFPGLDGLRAPAEDVTDKSEDEGDSDEEDLTCGTAFFGGFRKRTENSTDSPGRGEVGSRVEIGVVVLPRTSWVNDSDVKRCANDACKAAFSTFLRRHHCRFCGDIFCGSCSKDVLQSQRACASCFAKYSPRIVAPATAPSPLKKKSESSRCLSTYHDGSEVAPSQQRSLSISATPTERRHVPLRRKDQIASCPELNSSKFAEYTRIRLRSSLDVEESVKDGDSRNSFTIHSSPAFRNVDVNPADIQSTGSLKSFFL